MPPGLSQHPPKDLTDERLRNFLTNAAQLVDSVKQERQPAGSWSECDQSVRDELSAILEVLAKRQGEMQLSRDMRYIPQGDWRDQREIHKELGEVDDKGVHPTDWEYMGRVLKAHSRIFERLHKPTCFHCAEIIETVVIRCLDCKAPLHDYVCAERHFWPNGRPRS